jgi:hypothetical protein
MSNDLITPETLSKELLRSIFDAAFMETSWDSDGDLRVKDQISCFVIPSEKKDRIRLISFFGFKKGTAQVQRLECINNINKSYIMVRAIVGGNDSLQFDYDIYVQGGITAKNIVMATKRFLSIPHDAVADYGKDIVE